MRIKLVRHLGTQNLDDCDCHYISAYIISNERDVPEQLSVANKQP